MSRGEKGWTVEGKKDSGRATSPFALVNAIRLRTGQLADGAPPVVEVDEVVHYDYPVRIAMRELEAGKLGISYVDRPVAQPQSHLPEDDKERFVHGEPLDVFQRAPRARLKKRA